MLCFLKIKKIAQEGFSFLPVVLRYAAPVFISSSIITAATIRFLIIMVKASADDFVEFAAIEPDSAALGAIVYFNMLAL